LIFDIFLKLKYACAIEKILHGLAPPPLSEFITLKKQGEGRTVTGFHQE